MRIPQSPVCGNFLPTMTKRDSGLLLEVWWHARFQRKWHWALAWLNLYSLCVAQGLLQQQCLDGTVKITK